MAKWEQNLCEMIFESWNDVHTQVINNNKWLFESWNDDVHTQVTNNNKWIPMGTLMGNKCQ